MKPSPKGTGEGVVDEILFTDVNVFDGVSNTLRPREVLIRGNRIAAVAKPGELESQQATEWVEGHGATLMPGLVNSHSHLSFTNFATIRELAELPVEEHVLQTACNAKLILDHGFTAVIGAGSAKERLDIAVRNEITAGRLEGPRMLAATPELTVTGGFADNRTMHEDTDVAAISCDGPLEFRKTVRRLIREGVDIVKMNLSGDAFASPKVPGKINPMMEEEIDAICETALGMERRLAAHAHADAAVLTCIEKGVQLIYHATYCQDSTIEALEKVRDQHFVTPAIGVRWAAVHEGEKWGITPDIAEQMGLEEEIDAACDTMTKMRKAGIKVLPFGDYGLAWTPHGEDTRDFEHMVNLFGFEPWEVLRAATAYGGEAFGDQMGQVRPEYLADLLLVNGNPMADLTLFRNPENLLAIMKDGQFHKRPQDRRATAKRAAA